MSQIGQFVAILEFYIVFVGNGRKQPLCRKKWYHRHKLRFERNDFFSYNKSNGTNITENSYAPEKEPHTANPIFPAKNSPKNTIIWSKKWLSQKEDKNYLEDLFPPQTCVKWVKSCCKLSWTSKMSHIGQFLAMFCIIFVGNCQMLLLW